MPMPAALARVPAQLEPTKPEPAQAEPAKREPAQPEFAKPEPAKVAAPPADPWRAFWKVMP
jgi:colicin import membrane protein